MNKAEAILKLLLLRVTGMTMMVAVVAVFMPRAWMAWAHEWLRMGEFPAGPTIEYLARALSAMYAIAGGLLWLAAADIRRYAAVITYMALVIPAMAVVILVYGLRMGLPAYWVLGDVVSAVLWGVATLAFQRAAKSGPVGTQQDG